MAKGGQLLRVLLMKKGLTDPMKVLRAGGKHVALRTDLKFSGLVVTKEYGGQPPGWSKFVQQGVTEKLDTLDFAGSGAVLFVSSAGRLFAITFGFGRNLIKPECFERDFGLKVTLNASKADSLRCVDCERFEDLTLQTRKQSSQGTDIDSFGISVNEEVLRQVAGVPSDKKVGARVAGSDGLAIYTDVKFEDLGAKCEELLKLYRKKTYQKLYPWVDNLHAVEDPSIIKSLDDELISAVTNKSDDLHMSPPEPVDWEEIEFVYERRKDAEKADDLTVESFVATFQNGQQVSAEFLKTRRIGISRPGEDHVDWKWRAYDCLVFEVDLKGLRYILTGGDWFQIDNDFFGKVDSRVSELAKAAPVLPPSKKGQWEGKYNKDVAKKNGWALLDAKCPRVAGSSIEACDLLTDDLRFVHVKRKARSSTLSHLFNQGVVSWEVYLNDGTFRKAVKSKVDKSNKPLAAKLPGADDDVVRSDFGVVYAIIGGKAKDWPRSLPFFSKLSLMNASDKLRNLGIQTKLTRVDTQ